MIHRATMKGDGAAGNPKGFFQGRFKIDGVERTFTDDYRVLTTEEFEKEQVKFGRKIFFKKFSQIGDAIILSYNDDMIEPMDRQKKNFITELIKCPEMRMVDDEPNATKFWICSLGNEVSVRKASKLMKTIKILNILMGMSYKERINVAFFFAPERQPDKMNNSELFIMLGDIKPDHSGNPSGVLINSELRMNAVFETYYKDTEDSQFRTTIHKALEWSIIKHEPKGYYLNDEYIGGDREQVYVFLKNHPDVFEKFVLPKVAQRDSTLAEDDMVKVNAVKYEMKYNVDREAKTLDDLRLEAKALQIPRAMNYWDRAKLIGLIEAKITENLKSLTLVLFHPMK